MRWTPKSSDTVPWWLWLLVPIWGPCFALIVAFFAALYYLTLAKRHLIGPSDHWRPWFAWHPVELPWDEMPREAWPDSERVWLEWIERRSGHVLGDAQYRSTPPRPNSDGVGEAGKAEGAGR